MNDTKRQIFQFPNHCLHYFHKNIIEYDKFHVYVIINKKAFQSNGNCPLDNRMGFIMNKFEHVQGSPCGKSPHVDGGGLGLRLGDLR